MTALELLDHAHPVSQPVISQRSIRRLLSPLFAEVEQARAWKAESLGFWETSEGRYWMPRLIFRPPDANAEIKVAIFAGVHGDEPAGVLALCDLVRVLQAAPVHAEGYELHLYPLVNPTGYEDNTRHARSGKDLNREFWCHSTEPEVTILEKEIRQQSYQGFISLHSDDTSPGLYGFARGATLTQHLLKPALAAAENALPVNRDEVIDGFHAIEGIIHSCYGGILSAPPDARPQPFEIILESPTAAPMHLQRAAFVLALSEILKHYRTMIAYGGEL